MEPTESDFLFSAIGVYLGECRQAAEMQSRRDYWKERPFLTGAEMELVARLAEEPLCAEEIAAQFGRELCVTRKLLGALLSIGILELHGDRYEATPSASLYCRTIS